MPTYTPNYNLAKPLVDDPVDEDLWGGYLNDDLDTLDTTIKTVSDSSLPFVTAEANLASAATTDIGATASGNIRITGTTTITSFGTAAAGVYRKIRFADALTLTHNATSLILPGGANITTAAGDILEAFSLGSGNWVARYYTKASGLPVIAPPTIQMVSYQTGAASSGTTTIPFDDSIPQNTEGDEYMSVTITPTSASSKLKVDVTIYISTVGRGIAALFRDSTASALAAGAFNVGNVSVNLLQLSHTVTAGSTSATTFKVRAGSDAAGTTTFNGEGGGRLFGGAMSSSITVTEYEP